MQKPSRKTVVDAVLEIFFISAKYVYIKKYILIYN